MASTLASSDQASNKDNWDSGQLACKRQLLTEIAPRNRLIALVGLLRSYAVKTQGVDNDKGAVALIAFGARFYLMMTNRILLVLNGLKATRQIHEIRAIVCLSSMIPSMECYQMKV
ncbi:hypothetical protein J1N35_000411 [Gossypium stocksii]|uniref:Uncharacterized protein n=1 Tax=Gossypium stocksii TaxID=47602 RepID=A0A9D4AKS4_9ROSI|nr:hypothetical protein J1N35_000411 [Gossypium stocksii]